MKRKTKPEGLSHTLFIRIDERMRKDIRAAHANLKRNSKTGRYSIADFVRECIRLELDRRLGTSPSPAKMAPRKARGRAKTVASSRPAEQPSEAWDQ